MITDRISNAKMYYPLGEKLEAGLKFLQQINLSDLNLGRHDILGDDCYALVMEYDTDPQSVGVWEAHRRYMDLQCIVIGREKMGYANIDSLRVTQEYDDSEDALLLDGEGSYMVLGPGDFALFAPQDAHMPSLAADGSEHIRKVVVKIKV